MSCVVRWLATAADDVGWDVFCLLFAILSEQPVLRAQWHDSRAFRVIRSGTEEARAWAGR